MTPEAQRIAIAEACGWKDISPCDTKRFDGTKSHVDYLGTPPPPRAARRWLPDYLNDLNAMHTVEMACANQLGDSYAKWIRWAIHRDAQLETKNQVLRVATWRNYCANAAQRAEAFLRTIGKWEGACK